MSASLVSDTALLVPVYNGAGYINRFHQSVLDLENGFEEVLFFDDASTDGSADMLTSLGYTVISSEKNLGQAAARNALLKATRSTWVHFHDIDDLMLPMYLTDTVQLAVPGVDAVICDADWLDDRTRDVILQWHYSNAQLKKEKAGYLLRHPIGGINGLYRRDTLLELEGFDENLKIWEDADLHLRLALHHKNIVFTETVLVQALRQNNSISSSSSAVRAFQLAFLKKFASSEDEAFNNELKERANKLFHEIVYQKDWALYAQVLELFSAWDERPPLTRNFIDGTIKTLLGPKQFTLLKKVYLTKILGVNIHQE